LGREHHSTAKNHKQNKQHNEKTKYKQTAFDNQHDDSPFQCRNGTPTGTVQARAWSVASTVQRNVWILRLPVCASAFQEPALYRNYSLTTVVKLFSKAAYPKSRSSRAVPQGGSTEVINITNIP
jgi:hypothetical protein